MIIDTDKVNGWIKTHSKICVPVGTGFFSWYAALRWQAAMDANHYALMTFYFFASASSGIVALVLAIHHFIRLGLFGDWS